MELYSNRAKPPSTMTHLPNDVVIVGGGAAGIFAALSAKEASPALSVTLLEKSVLFLSKVRVSGGGRCNVTHACFDPQKLIQNYPRGEKELLGPFYRFQPKDTIAWFESRAVLLKTEKDGRVFPTTDQSQTIIDALLNEARKLGVDLRIRQHIISIFYSEGHFHTQLRDGTSLCTKALLLATGSSPEGYRFAESLGHTIQPPVPSLFTFNVPTSRLTALSGVAVQNVVVSLPEISMKQSGPLLITHFGFSGPATLKLSAWAARELHALQYKTIIHINWVPQFSLEELKNKLNKTKLEKPSKTLGQLTLFDLPKNLWKVLTAPFTDKTLAHLSYFNIEQLCKTLHADPYQMDGKTTHKEEFVTCGGVTLKEVDFKTMQSKILPGLFFAGEILNIDGVTGGFNFQNAWTTGYLAGQGFLMKKG
ncbi:MAG: NAD(P)/FAD-dependent oxidoreductase [Rhabdochlamydiaceae bacterium]